MIFKEDFYNNSAPFNPLLHIRCSGELHPDPTYCIERENSKTGTIMYITSGILKIKYEENCYSVIHGDSFILPPKRKYVIKSDQNNPVGIIWINIRGKLFKGIYDILFPDENFPIKTCSLNKEIRSLFEIMGDKNNFLTAASSVIQIMLKIYSSESVHRNKAFDNESLEGQFEFYISKCIQEGFSIKDMCDYFYMSKDNLNKIFKEIMHTTPYQYYQNLRLEIAKSILLNSDLSIEEVSDRLHFNDRNHFTTFFIKKAGIPPATFRIMNKQ